MRIAVYLDLSAMYPLQWAWANPYGQEGVIMSRRISCRLLLAALCCLLANAQVQDAQGKEVRDVSILGANLALRVPVDIAVSPEKPTHPGGGTLQVEVKTIESFRRNGVVSMADVLAQRTALAKGHATVADEWEEEGLADAVSLPIGGYAAVYPWYSPFEICGLEFTMNAAFFVGNQRVILRYSVPHESVIAENPGFFGHDKNNCGKSAVWKHSEPGLLKRFHQAAKAGRLGPVANAWYADFTAILASLHQKTPQK
jgi:hypothetical protein